MGVKAVESHKQTVAISKNKLECVLLRDPPTITIIYSVSDLIQGGVKKLLNCRNL